MTYNQQLSSVVRSLSLVGSLVLCFSSAKAGTVAYWRFEEGPAGANIAHTVGNGVFEAAVFDASGNGNHLSAFTADNWGASHYTTDVAANLLPAGLGNSYSIKNSGGYPGLWAASSYIGQSWTPDRWTIEAAFKPENGGWRTLVGRDSRGTATINGDLAALYFQITPDNQMAIKYCDVAGFWHEAISGAGLVKGFNWGTDPDGLTGVWQAAAAVCNGTTLSLYYRDLDANSGWDLVAQTDLTLSGSSNLSLTGGAGDGSDWDAGNWSVGRGLYAGGHGDRAYGFIDEVRISDSALSIGQFIFVPEPSTMALALLGGLGLFARRFARR